MTPRLRCVCTIRVLFVQLETQQPVSGSAKRIGLIDCPPPPSRSAGSSRQTAVADTTEEHAPFNGPVPKMDPDTLLSGGRGQKTKRYEQTHWKVACLIQNPTYVGRYSPGM